MVNKKVIAAVAILLAAGAVAAYNLALFKKRPYTEAIQYVCVKSGKFYSIARDGRTHVLPRVNPDTGEATLVPVYEEDGQWLVSKRQRGLIQDLGELNQYVDAKSLAVKSSP